MRLILIRGAGLAALLLAFLVFLGCEEGELFGEDVAVHQEALEVIQERGSIRAITSHNPVSYFIYRGEPMGYEYELLMQLAYDLGVDLEIIIEHDVDQMFEMLERGEGDLIAHRLPVTKHHGEQVLFTNHLKLTRQVLVQRIRGEADEEFDPAMLIEEPYELDGDTVHVLDEEQYTQRMENLAAEIGGEIDVITVPPDVTTSELAALVARGEIDYTVTHEEIGVLEAALHDNVATQPILSLSQRIAWAVRNDSPAFLERVNEWLNEFQETPEYTAIHNRYFRDRLGYTSRMTSPFISLTGDRISEYDDIIREAVNEVDALNWDWRLVAALIQQESRFNPQARSWAGALGLMQLMPPTAREFGVGNIYDPQDNVRGGLQFLVWLENYWADRILDPEERRKFVLASYNTGHGHVEDARRLTDKFGGDPDIWDDVAYYLLRKSQREFYEDEVVRYGYSRGSEPVAYVQTILNSYRHYTTLLEAAE